MIIHQGRDDRAYPYPSFASSSLLLPSRGWFLDLPVDVSK
jgi:hypothetical protein